LSNPNLITGNLPIDILNSHNIENIKNSKKKKGRRARPNELILHRLNYF
jgi:hypothetical protein